jgi:hypothetical protein
MKQRNSEEDYFVAYKSLSGFPSYDEKFVLYNIVLYYSATINDEEPTKKLMLGKPDGTRRRGRPKLQWIDGLEKDLHNISIRNW